MNYSNYNEKTFKKEEFISLMKKEHRLKFKLDSDKTLKFEDRRGSLHLFKYTNEENIIKIIEFEEIVKVAPCVGIGGNIFSEW